MSVISFDDWTKRKSASQAFTQRGALREDVALKEEYGYDLCVFIAEERMAPNCDLKRIEQLRSDLSALLEELPHEHAYHYFTAFTAFLDEDFEGYVKAFDKYLESEKQLYDDVAPCDWWIDSFMWVFMPPMQGMYGKTAELFFKYWPLCSIGLVLEALEMGEGDNENLDDQLDMVMLAITADEKCYLAYYVAATIYSDMQMWKSALPYFEKAADSEMYSNDPSFYFDYAWAAQKAKANQLSIDMYNSAVLLDETFPCALNNMGCVYIAMGDYDSALSQFYRAISLEIDGNLPHKNVVVALEKAGRLEQCIKFINQNAEALGLRYELEATRLQTLVDSGETLTVAEDVVSAGERSGIMDAMFNKWLMQNRMDGAISGGAEMFGRKLRVHSDEHGYGMSYYITGGGRIDLLCRDEKDNYVVIAICSESATERAVGQLCTQIDCVNSQLAKGFEKVSGVLCCQSARSEAKLLAGLIPGKSIEIYEFGFSMTRVY